MTARRPVFLGIDLGTSAIKVVAVAEDGSVDAVARHRYPTARPQPGAAEQNPRDWFSAVEKALEAVARAVPADSWVGMGLTGMLPTLVECDDRGAPLAPAITWEDARAEPEAAEFRAAIGDDELYRITGQRVDGRYLGPMHERLHRLGHGGSLVAGAKDVIFAHLTGDLLTDPSTAAGTGVFDIEASAWVPELVDAVHIPRLPTVAAAAAIRPLLPRWRSVLGVPAELPVVLGAADSVLGALGVGAVSHGDVAIIAGTSAIVLGISASPVRDSDRRYLVTPLTGIGWGLEMDLLAMGSAFDGIARLLGLPGPEALLEAAAAVSPGDAPIFLPYLTPGEQGALWDPGLTGAVHGLHLGMTAAHVGRALLTGIVVEFRRCVDILEASTGCRGPILLGGRSAVSRLMWQDIADATGREVRVNPGVSDHSAIGAALFAADALGQTIRRAGSAVSIVPRTDRYPWWTESLAEHDALRLRQNSSRVS